MAHWFRLSLGMLHFYQDLVGFCTGIFMQDYNHFLTMGIESSCDDTSVAVLKGNQTLLAMVKKSDRKSTRQNSSHSSVSRMPSSA